MTENVGKVSTTVLTTTDSSVNAGKVSTTVLTYYPPTTVNSGKVATTVLTEPTDTTTNSGKTSLNVLLLNHITPYHVIGSKASQRWNLDTNYRH